MADPAQVMELPIARQLLREETIDVPGPPPRVLLVRGPATLATVDGVPDRYLEASRRALPPEAWDGFDTQVRAMYKHMVAITVTPEWARLLDFETTAPEAVEKLLRQQTPPAGRHS